ncbi:hypothetical protein B5807_05298 [Epicoccum nigrum]|uniref:Complex III subunit 9 n=1 Tax=Epicoccum nigrum TaxID=105696 RepID=A0A1Y2LZB4_EPING|nr:hypothetical protein B5807_05298 [Epicoccum nigrum]
MRYGGVLVLVLWWWAWASVPRARAAGMMNFGHGRADQSASPPCRRFSSSGLRTSPRPPTAAPQHYHIRLRSPPHPVNTVKMAGFANTVYNTVIRSNITLLGTVFAAAFGMQLAFDTGSDRVWDSMNRGRQWKDIKQRYIEAAEDDE